MFPISKAFSSKTHTQLKKLGWIWSNIFNLSNGADYSIVNAAVEWYDVYPIKAPHLRDGSIHSDKNYVASMSNIYVLQVN